MAEDKLVDSTQLDNGLTSIANAIRAKSGGSSQLAFPAGFVSEIQAIPSGGGGETVYYTTYTGAPYTKNVVIPEAAYLALPILREAGNMETLKFSCSSAWTATTPIVGYALSDCPSLKSVELDASLNLSSNSRLLRNNTALETAIIGGIGKPLNNTSINANLFQNCTQNGLTVTIYVTPETTLPLSGSPWGATNATIVYKSSVDGSVLTP